MDQARPGGQQGQPNISSVAFVQLVCTGNASRLDTNLGTLRYAGSMQHMNVTNA